MRQGGSLWMNSGSASHGQGGQALIKDHCNQSDTSKPFTFNHSDTESNQNVSDSQYLQIFPEKQGVINNLSLASQHGKDQDKKRKFSVVHDKQRNKQLMPPVDIRRSSGSLNGNYSPTLLQQNGKRTGKMSSFKSKKMQRKGSNRTLRNMSSKFGGSMSSINEDEVSYSNGSDAPTDKMIEKNIQVENVDFQDRRKVSIRSHEKKSRKIDGNYRIRQSNDVSSHNLSNSTKVQSQINGVHPKVPKIKNFKITLNKQQTLTKEDEVNDIDPDDEATIGILRGVQEKQLNLIRESSTKNMEAQLAVLDSVIGKRTNRKSVKAEKKVNSARNKLNNLDVEQKQQENKNTEQHSPLMGKLPSINQNKRMSLQLGGSMNYLQRLKTQTIKGNPPARSPSPGTMLQAHSKDSNDFSQLSFNGKNDSIQNQRRQSQTDSKISRSIDYQQNGEIELGHDYGSQHNSNSNSFNYNDYDSYKNSENSLSSKIEKNSDNSKSKDIEVAMERDMQVVKPQKIDRKQTRKNISASYLAKIDNEQDNLFEDNIPQIDLKNVKEKDKQKAERMRYRQNKKSCIFYPEDQSKVYWDLWITVILLASCMITPYRIAFGDLTDPLGWSIINYSIDGFFLIDIFVILNSAYYDDEYLIVENRKQIAREYIRSWFLIDFLAIVPFDTILASFNDYQDIIRIVRIGRIYKLIKMTRLLRILKIVKERSKLLKYLNDILKIGLGFERLFFFALIFIILCHIVTCIWVMSADFGDESFDDTWVQAGGYDELSNTSRYITSFYFTVSTITTVGYGDISGSNTLEKGVAVVIMIIGVMAFSFATGSLSSILQNYDHANAKLQERISILNRVYKEYWLPLDLYQRLKQAVKYDYNKDKNDINNFVAELPHKLKLEVSLFIHEQTYKKIDCFRGRSSAFIAWICPLLKPFPYPENQYIYFEGDDITNVYFLIRGRAGYVLPKYKNTTYIEIHVGDRFGITDIVGSILQAKFDLDNWIIHKDILQRQFTVMSLSDSEAMCLEIQDLNRMKQEFLEAYQKLFGDSYTRLRRALMLKLKAMKICQEREENNLTNRSYRYNRNGEPVNLTNQIKLTNEEEQDIDDEVNYKLQPIKLNQIDEASIENSSDSIGTDSSFESEQSLEKDDDMKSNASKMSQKNEIYGSQVLSPKLTQITNEEDKSTLKERGSQVPMTSPIKDLSQGPVKMSQSGSSSMTSSSQTSSEAESPTSPGINKSKTFREANLQPKRNSIFQLPDKQQDPTDLINAAFVPKDIKQSEQEGKQLLRKLSMLNKPLVFGTAAKRINIEPASPDIYGRAGSLQSQQNVPMTKSSFLGFEDKQGFDIERCFDQLFKKMDSIENNQKKEFWKLNERIERIENKIGVNNNKKIRRTSVSNISDHLQKIKTQKRQQENQLISKNQADALQKKRQSVLVTTSLFGFLKKDSKKDDDKESDKLAKFYAGLGNKSNRGGNRQPPSRNFAHSSSELTKSGNNTTSKQEKPMNLLGQLDRIPSLGSLDSSSDSDDTVMTPYNKSIKSRKSKKSQHNRNRRMSLKSSVNKSRGGKSRGHMSMQKTKSRNGVDPSAKTKDKQSTLRQKESTREKDQNQGNVSKRFSRMNMSPMKLQDRQDVTDTFSSSSNSDSGGSMSSHISKSQSRDLTPLRPRSRKSRNSDKSLKRRKK